MADARDRAPFPGHQPSRALEPFVLGCSQLGGLYRPMSDADADAVLQAAWTLGVRHFDTAPHYGAGLSERRLGRFLAGKPRDAFTISTKVGRLLVDTDEEVEGEFSFFGGDRKRRLLDYTADGIRRSLAESLTRLGLDRVDTLYVHDPAGANLDIAIRDGYPALDELRSEGVVKHIGVGTNEIEELERFVRETAIDVAMFAGRYTLLDRSGEAVLDDCADSGIRVVAAGVYNSGLLADPRPGSHFDYEAAPTWLVARALELKEACSAAGVPLRAAAVQFVLRHPAVVQVALGSRTPAQVADNVAMFTEPIPNGLWGAIGVVGQAPDKA